MRLRSQVDQSKPRPQRESTPFDVPRAISPKVASYTKGNAVSECNLVSPQWEVDASRSPGLCGHVKSIVLCWWNGSYSSPHHVQLQYSELAFRSRALRRYQAFRFAEEDGSSYTCQATTFLTLSPIALHPSPNGVSRANKRDGTCCEKSESLEPRTLILRCRLPTLMKRLAAGSRTMMRETSRQMKHERSASMLRLQYHFALALLCSQLRTCSLSGVVACLLRIMGYTSPGEGVAALVTSRSRVHKPPARFFEHMFGAGGVTTGWGVVGCRYLMSHCVHIFITLFWQLATSCATGVPTLLGLVPDD
eukprot:307839-Amphidinium_carterae.1